MNPAQFLSTAIMFGLTLILAAQTLAPNVYDWENTPEQLTANYAGFPMRKDGKSVWAAAIGPIEPGTYRYNFVADGVADAK